MSGCEPHGRLKCPECELVNTLIEEIERLKAELEKERSRPSYWNQDTGRGQVYFKTNFQTKVKLTHEEFAALKTELDLTKDRKIEELKAELKAERLTVDWYADSAKWQFEKPEEVGFYKEGEGVFFVDEYGLRLCDGGSRARQRQKERKDDV